MAAPLIGIDFAREVSLPDGTAVRLRLLGPGDRQRLAAGMRELSDQSRYYRFLSATQALPERALRYLTDTDNQNHLAVVAGSPRGEGYGVARFVRDAPGSPRAEAAVTVIDALQGRGLGRLLLAALAVAASERGVRCFHAEILAQNTAMLGLLAELGATVDATLDGDVVEIDLPLPAWSADGSLLGSHHGAGAQLIRFAARELHLLGAGGARP